ncbi:MAG TPA: cyclic pyranopterin monophosphate synthase MoaC [Nitrospiria bacterium]|nr:cyclic pyranopterin monophosphate synthase MoaC [Nitrospiria bacterium]
MSLSHLNKNGRARMVDIGGKPQTTRTATATGKIYLSPETLRLIQKRSLTKGDVLAVAQVAGVMAAKQVPDLIPLCHPLLLSGVEMHFKEDPNTDSENRCSIGITATVKVFGQTGVEMEAMTAVCVAALTIYDMCKALDREMSIGEIMLLSKAGGKSGTFRRPSRGRK